MNVESLQIGLVTGISIFSAVVTALISGLSVFYALKMQLTVTKNKVEDLEKGSEVLHSRISSLKEQEERNKNFLSKEVQIIRKEISEMRVEIIKEIHQSKNT